MHCYARHSIDLQCIALQRIAKQCFALQCFAIHMHKMGRGPIYRGPGPLYKGLVALIFSPAGPLNSGELHQH